MAEQIGSIQVNIGANIESLSKGLKSASKSLEDFGKRADKLGRDMSLKLTTPILGMGTAAVMSAGKFEKLRTSLNVLTGSAEEGSKAFERLVQFSAGTPFQLDELVKANNTLLGFTLSSEESYNALKNIGDIAAVTGGDIQSISVAFGKSAAQGRLMGEELDSLINNGVPIIDMLATSMGVATSEVKKMVSEGAVTFPVLVKAFEDATAAGGKFENGAAEQAQTIFGLFSTLKDNVNIALAEIGNSLAENLNLAEVVGNLTQYVQGLTASFKALTPEAQKKIIAIAALVAGIGPLLILIGQMSIGLSALAGAFAFIVSPIGLVIAAVGALAAAFIYIADNWAAVKERVSDWSWWNNMLIDMIQFVLNNNPFAIVLDLYNDFAGTLGLATLPNPFESMSGFLEGLRMETKQYENEFGTFSEAVVNGAKRAGEALGFLQSKSQAITPPSTEDANAIVSGAAAGATGGAGASGPTIPPIADEVINEMDLIYEAMETLPTVVETIGEGVKLSAQTATGAIAQIASAMRGLAGDSKALALFEIAANTARGIAAAVAAGAGVPFPGNIGAIASGIATVLGGIGQAKAALSSVPAFAQGGMVTGPTLAMVGDNASGKEAIIPFEKMGAFMNMMGGSNVNVNITGEFDGDALRLVLDKSNKELNSIR